MLYQRGRRVLDRDQPPIPPYVFNHNNQFQLFEWFQNHPRLYFTKQNRISDQI